MFFMGLIWKWFSMNGSIVHINREVSGFNVIVEHGVDYHLEGCQGVGQSEEHYLRLE